MSRGFCAHWLRLHFTPFQPWHRGRFMCTIFLHHFCLFYSMHILYIYKYAIMLWHAQNRCTSFFSMTHSQHVCCKFIYIIPTLCSKISLAGHIPRSTLILCCYACCLLGWPSVRISERINSVSVVEFWQLISFLIIIWVKLCCINSVSITRLLY